MKKIQIVGTGCPRCAQLERNTVLALEEIEGDYKIEKIEDIDHIISMGVLMTPAFAIDGVVKTSGKVLSPEQIRSFLSE